MKKNILVVDDSALMRRIICDIINSDKTFRATDVCRDGLEAYEQIRKGKYDAVICLGTVIRGATPHFDYVCAEASKGIAQVSLQTGVPVAFGVLTTETIQQAVERAGTKALDHMLRKFSNIIDKLLVYPDAMIANLNKTGGLIFSQNLLIALVTKGVLREDAYKWVQRNAMARWLEGADFKTNVEADPDIKKYLTDEEIEHCFDPKPMLRNVDLIFSRFGL